MMTAAGASHSLALAGSPLPRVLSLPASGVATTGATLNGTVNAAGNDATGSFEYGSTSAYGASIAAAPSLLAGASDTSVSADLSGLPPGTTWHYRAVAATNSGVAVTGADMTFTTPSNNALLAALFLDAGSLAPQFNKTSTSYLATVSNATTAVAVTPTTEHPGASVQVNGVPVSSGDPSAPISLPVGATTITAAVTAEDGITTNAYTITVTRLLPELDDPDHDGLPNLLEYAFGLEAQQSSAVALPHGKLVGGNYVVEFTEPVGVTGITYGAESSASLLPGSWSEVPDSGTDSDHIFSVPVTGGRLFMRLRVTQQ